jgi:hypothetical protein
VIAAAPSVRHRPVISSSICLAMQATQQGFLRSTGRSLVFLKCHRGSKTTNQFSNLINPNHSHSRSSKGVNPAKRAQGGDGPLFTWPAPSTRQVRAVSRSTLPSRFIYLSTDAFSQFTGVTRENQRTKG